MREQNLRLPEHIRIRRKNNHWEVTELIAFSHLDDDTWGPFSWVLDAIETACMSLLKSAKKRARESQIAYEPFRTIKLDELEKGFSERSIQVVRYIYDSMVVMIYSHLEQRLNFICESFADLLDLRISLEEIRGPDKSIERARTFMEEQLQLKVPTDSLEWDEIMLLKALRNCIVHEGGRIKNAKRKARLVRYAQDHPDRLSSVGDRFYVEPAYPDWIIQQSNNFLGLLHQQNEKRLQLLKKKFIALNR